jgi:hypothetical protein
MTETRYHELLGRLLDGSICESDAEELCRELERDPDRLRNVREHLLLSELLAQEHAPSRAPEAFWQGIQSRIRAEADGAVTGDAATRPRRTSEPTTRRKYRRLASGIAASLLISIAIASLWSGLRREPVNDPSAVPGILGSNLAVATHVSLHGKAVCTHCTLHQTKECQPAVRIRGGEGEQTLFLSDNAISRDFKRRQGCCRTPLLVYAEGTVRSEHGRLLLGATRLEIQR